MKNRLLGLGAACVTILCVLYLTWKVEQVRRPLPSRVNILILSLCSFRYQLLTHYSGLREEVMPATEKFFRESSVVFDNAFNGLTWEGMFSYLGPLMTAKEMQTTGYHLLGAYDYGELFRVPDRKSDFMPPDVVTNDNDWEKNIQLSVQQIASFANSPFIFPFLSMVHFKYLHYPLIDRFNADAEWDYYLSLNERRQVNEYLNHPEKYPEKLPFLMLVANDPTIALSHPRVQKLRWPKDAKSRKQLTGLLVNEEFLQEWKASPDFERDRQLLEKIYRGTARYMDSVLKPMFDLWNNPRLKETTMIILSGDHGELHMEHDGLTHATVLYDEALKVPMALSFPGYRGSPIVIRDQIDFGSLSRFIQRVMLGEVNATNLKEKIKEGENPTLLARDCEARYRGLRYANKWKYFVQVADQQRFLFDLKEDPHETKNLASKLPDVADAMEARYWENFPEFSKLGTFTCPPMVPTPAPVK